MRRFSQSGFSLVELMVVVGIIGILATLVVPMYDKFAFKARQSEAKIQLSALHAAEKSFFTEYNKFHTYFQAIGYSPEGNVRYNIGFGSAGVSAGAADGYYTTFPLSSKNTKEYCGGAGGAAVLGNSCNLLVGADGLPVPPLPAALTSAGTSYTAGAYMFVPSGYAFEFLDFNSELMTASTFGPPFLFVRAAFSFTQIRTQAAPIDTNLPNNTAYNPFGPTITSDSWLIDESGQLSHGGPVLNCANVVGSPAGGVIMGPSSGDPCSSLDVRFTTATPSSY